MMGMKRGASRILQRQPAKPCRDPPPAELAQRFINRRVANLLLYNRPACDRIGQKDISPKRSPAGGKAPCLMGNVRNKRRRGRVGPNGGHRPRLRKDNKDRWLERRIRGLYQGALEEPVPEDMLHLVDRIGRSDPSTTEALTRARRWRAKAEECKAAAESMETEAARRWFLLLARSYEALAEHAEQEARQLSDKEQKTG
jgi:hypothetical protein